MNSPDITRIRLALEALPDIRMGPPPVVFTPEMDRLLLDHWPRKPKAELARAFGMAENTLRKRYRELTASTDYHHQITPGPGGLV